MIEKCRRQRRSQANVLEALGFTPVGLLGDRVTLVDILNIGVCGSLLITLSCYLMELGICCRPSHKQDKTNSMFLPLNFLID